MSLILLATILVVARLVARKTSAANLWWDDFVSNSPSECCSLSGSLRNWEMCHSRNSFGRILSWYHTIISKYDADFEIHLDDCCRIGKERKQRETDLDPIPS